MYWNILQLSATRLPNMTSPILRTLPPSSQQRPTCAQCSKPIFLQTSSVVSCGYASVTTKLGCIDLIASTHPLCAVTFSSTPGASAAPHAITTLQSGTKFASWGLDGCYASHASQFAPYVGSQFRTMHFSRETTPFITTQRVLHVGNARRHLMGNLPNKSPLHSAWNVIESGKRSRRCQNMWKTKKGNTGV